MEGAISQLQTDMHRKRVSVHEMEEQMEEQNPNVFASVQVGRSLVAAFYWAALLLL